jgi:hypothetical protein
MSFYYRLPAALIAATIAIVQPEFAVAQLSAQQVEEISAIRQRNRKAIRLNPNDASVQRSGSDQGDNRSPITTKLFASILTMG